MGDTGTSCHSSWSCADQLRTSLNQLKTAAMLQHIPNQHMQFFFNRDLTKRVWVKSPIHKCLLLSQWFECWFAKLLKNIQSFKLKLQYHIFVIATWISVQFSKDRDISCHVLMYIFSIYFNIFCQKGSLIIYISVFFFLYFDSWLIVQYNNTHTHTHIYI